MMIDNQIHYLDQIHLILIQYIQQHIQLFLGQTRSEDHMHHDRDLHVRRDLLHHHDLLHHDHRGHHAHLI